MNNDNLEKFVSNNRLLEVYGRLLTESQLEIMTDYYENNLSLSEISELKGISRTAVSDALKVSVSKLEGYEEKLGLLKAIDNLKSSEENKEVLEKLEEVIRNGI